MNSTSTFCSECGSPVPSDAHFCGECGNKIIHQKKNSQSHSDKQQSQQRSQQQSRTQQSPDKTETPSLMSALIIWLKLPRTASRIKRIALWLVLSFVVLVLTGNVLMSAVLIIIIYFVIERVLKKPTTSSTDTDSRH